MAAAAQLASHLLQAANGVRHELQTKLAHHRVEAAIPEWQRLCVSHHTAKRGVINSVARCSEHRLRDIYTNHPTMRSSRREREQGGLAWASGNIQDPVANAHVRGTQHTRDEQARPPPKIRVVCAQVDCRASARVEPRAELGTHLAR